MVTQKGKSGTNKARKPSQMNGPRPSSVVARTVAKTTGPSRRPRRTKRDLVEIATDIAIEMYAPALRELEKH
jgi:hypothetical protein